MLFVHSGAGTLHTQFGSLRFDHHDYLVIPRGTVYRVEFDHLESTRVLVMEVAGAVDSPDRYRASNGQLTEFAPYSERDLRAPEALEQGEGTSQLWLKRAGHMSCYSLDHHPFDVVGWDGTVYPIAFNIHDFEPRAGRFHLPAAAHQTFQAANIVICSFVPRKLGWDPEAVLLPYHLSLIHISRRHQDPGRRHHAHPSGDRRGAAAHPRRRRSGSGGDRDGGDARGGGIDGGGGSALSGRGGRRLTGQHRRPCRDRLSGWEPARLGRQLPSR